MKNKSKLIQIATAARTEGPEPTRARWRAPVLLFHPIRPQSYVDRMARIVVNAATAEFGEEILRRDMQHIERSLVDAGADAALVKREVRALEASIRRAIWERVLG
ncbi:hypothetical protein [Bradyrhizobium vignae]|uniref:hypothetical protein n=1 Tax=Bradyrhizobium vignae TaxID=1549949 RepID=UPI00100B3E97|nr:hypothetical protein [Bradyrhizobium vignae]RXG92278.1 hypothetical protein EAV90_27220 [Bradyrhizobium vignae]